MRIWLMIVVGLVLIPSALMGQQLAHGTGLEWDGKELWIGIGDLSPDAQAMGLTEQRIRTHCEIRLRKAGLVPLATPAGTGYLSVDLVLRGTAFSMSVSMIRLAVYTASGATYQMLVKSWEKSGTGSHGKDAEYLLSALDRLLDGFLNDFAAANPVKR